MPADFPLKPIMTVNWFGGRLLSVYTVTDGMLRYLHCDPDRMLRTIFQAYDTVLLSEDDLMPCADCGVYTLNEYYIVHDDIWELAWSKHKSRSGFLCVGCLENRLGRTLTPGDFTDCPVNDLEDVRWFRSERLMHRLATRPR